MKQFFENYGAVALGILALLVLIAMITPVGNIIKTSLQGTAHKFSSSINSQTDTMSSQMSEIFEDTINFIHIREDGKIYKGDNLYTGWYENKAYLNGEENEIKTNLVAGNVWFMPNGSRPQTNQEMIDSGYNPEEFKIIVFKIDDKVLGEDYTFNRYNNLKASLGVSTFEFIVKTPSNYSATLQYKTGASNLTEEIISDDGLYKLTKMSGIIKQLYVTNDINIDDVIIAQS